MNQVEPIRKELKEKRDRKKSEILQGFFKTGKGEYGEGDLFWGVSVPDIRKIAKKHSVITLEQTGVFLSSKIHEERLFALFILIDKFEKGSDNEKEEIVSIYLKNTRSINNWDLVDSSAYKILGSYLFNKKKTTLYNLAISKNIWERRIAIIATFYFVKNNQFTDTLKIAEILLDDEHDLIHKAVGWMLREIGKRDTRVEEAFIEKHYKRIHRTTLRYAIEKFTKEKREYFLNR